jgi:NTP pyrophosphatase (non-canonical NTP hydrolase)
MKEPTQLQKLTKLVIDFRDQRDWGQFHNPKDLAIGLSLEASELLEPFLFKTAESSYQLDDATKSEVKDEIADVLYWLLLMANETNVDLEQALTTKLAKTALKYPVDKAKGNATKYTKL